MNSKDKVARALNQFPTLHELIGLEKILEIEKNDLNSDIIHYLKESLIDNDKVDVLKNELIKEPNNNNIKFLLYLMLKEHFIMNYLDELLSSIKNEEKISRYITHLLGSDSFLQGYAEIEVASLLKNLFNDIIIEPKLPNNKVVDISYTYNSNIYFVEVVAPRKGYKFENALKKSLDLEEAVISHVEPGRACEKIISEIRHFEGCLDKVNSIIIINMNESDFDIFEIEACLKGILKIVYLHDKKTDERVDAIVTRDSWTAFKQDNRLEKIGAVICYKRDFKLDGKPFYYKRMFFISFEEDKYEPLISLFS